MMESNNTSVWTILDLHDWKQANTHIMNSQMLIDQEFAIGSPILDLPVLTALDIFNLFNCSKGFRDYLIGIGLDISDASVEHVEGVTLVDNETAALLSEFRGVIRITEINPIMLLSTDIQKDMGIIPDVHVRHAYMNSEIYDTVDSNRYLNTIASSIGRTSKDNSGYTKVMFKSMNINDNLVGLYLGSFNKVSGIIPHKTDMINVSNRKLIAKLSYIDYNQYIKSGGLETGIKLDDNDDNGKHNKLNGFVFHTPSTNSMYFIHNKQIVPMTTIYEEGEPHVTIYDNGVKQKTIDESDFKKNNFHTDMDSAVARVSMGQESIESEKILSLLSDIEKKNKQTKKIIKDCDSDKDKLYKEIMKLSKKVGDLTKENRKQEIALDKKDNIILKKDKESLDKETKEIMDKKKKAEKPHEQMTLIKNSILEAKEIVVGVLGIVVAGAGIMAYMSE